MSEKENKLAETTKECFYRKGYSEEELRTLPELKYSIYCSRRLTDFRKEKCNIKDCFLYSAEKIEGR